MSGLASFTAMLCAVGVGVSMLSVLVPQKRTKRILGFVLGLFVLVSVIGAVRMMLGDLHLDTALSVDAPLPTCSDEDYIGEVAQITADTLVKATDELLREEGIAAEDIRITVSISDDGRIYADRVTIYISERYMDRKNDIEAIVYRNLSKEPDIYVKGQEAERADN